MKHKGFIGSIVSMRNYAILLCCFFTGLLSAQNLQVITGEVTDAMGEPLIGVSVLVKETSSGTITDMEGKFTVSADIGHTLQFSYVGYTTQNLVVASTAPFRPKFQNEFFGKRPHDLNYKTMPNHRSSQPLSLTLPPIYR